MQSALENYSRWFNSAVESLPAVYHYSWFDIERKIKTYKNYWQKHWESLYDITQDDSPENNMFFQKKWADVSDDDIKEMAQKLSTQMGGWVFHSPVDFEKPTPYLKPQKNMPSIMNKQNED